MKTALGVTAAALSSISFGIFSPAASAAVTVFDVSGALRNGSVLTGTISIDTAAGVSTAVTALNLTFTSGLNQFTGFTTSSIVSAAPFGNEYYRIEAGSATAPYADLFLHTNTLVGYTGGPLCTDFNVAPAFCGFSSAAYSANGAFSAFASGGLIPRAISGTVPEPATWAMMLLGFGAMGFALRRRTEVRAKVKFA